MRREKAYRGISKRLALDYLENLGGERTGERDDRVEGDGWSATVSAETVRAAGSVELTEVTVVFEGDEEPLEPLIESFSQKAMRAGG